MKAVTAQQMRETEQRSVEAGVSLDELMEKAGSEVALAVEAKLEQVAGSKIVVMVGPGNNGSDGLVSGRLLASSGAHVTAFALTGRPDPDEKRVLAEEAGVEFVELSGRKDAADVLTAAAETCDVLLDAVLGTGQSRPIEEPLAGLLHAARAASTVVAVDVPTGMNSDTGEFDKNGLPAHQTVMLGHPKIGPLVSAGDGACGQIDVRDIGIPQGLANDVKTELITPDLARSLLPERAGSANKGSFGRTLIVGGSLTYPGAPMLATRAALRSGCGLTYLATAEPVHRLIAGSEHEAIYLSLPADNDGKFDVNSAVGQLVEIAEGMDSVLIGPGLGQSTATISLVEKLVRNLPGNVPVALDADALNILSRTPNWSDQMAATRVLTPHPGEMARLLRMEVPEVQADRPSAALDAASRFNAVVILKGAATLIATPEGDLRISPWVNSGLAKGGTGDVLAGLLAGLLAQSPGRPFDMAALAVHLHGLAGDIAARQIGQRGMVAGDVANALPRALCETE